MLHIQTVEPHTLSLIHSLQEKPYLKGFLLVGGTALALQIGHRTSIDIDLFNHERFDVPQLLENLRSDFTIRIKNQMQHALLVEIETVKTDFVFQKSEMLESPLEVKNIRMASLKDIAAMKIGAITARGRKRDFIDLYCLFDFFSLPELLNAFLTKYKDATLELAIRSLFYFEDAENDPEPKCFFNYSWEKVKKTIRAEASKL